MSNLWSIKNFGNLRHMDERIMKMGMTDTVRNSFIALPIISVFELIMIVRWFFTKGSFSDTGALMYLGGYTALLAVSLITLLVIRTLSRDIERHYRRIYLMQLHYAMAIVAWALQITFTGSHFSGILDELVYVTIVIIVPVFCFLSPLQWTPVQLVSAGAVLCIATAHNGFAAFAINFTVFTLISIVASWTLFRVRYTAYQRQLELAEERDLTRHHACHDALTGLPNRRSYIEELEKLEKAERSDSLILAMFDVNGLKQVNDGIGHDAGDELLKGAAECLTQAFSPIGAIYRVGGDEYTGIFRGDAEALRQALERFQSAEAAWKNPRIAGLSVSVGIAAAADHPEASLTELCTIADDAMYAAKKAYHAAARAKG